MDADRFITGVCRSFAAHWLAARPPGAVMPSRDDLDPTEMPRLLPNLIVYDVGDSPDTVLYRLVGTAIVSRWGYDPTGRSYAAVVGREDGRASAEALRRVAHEPCAMRLVRRQQRPSGALDDVEVCCLPVWNERQQATQAMTASTPMTASERAADADADPVRERRLLDRRFFDLATGTRLAETG